VKENPFLKIRQQAEESQFLRPKGSPAIMSIDNLNKPSAELRKIAEKRERGKGNYIFYLSKADRELIDDLAICAGFVTKNGKANASAFISAMVHVLKETQI